MKQGENVYPYWQLLILLGMVELVRGALFIALIPVYVLEQLGGTFFLSGALISLQYAADTLAKPVAGWLVDYLGPRLTLQCGLPLAWCGLGIFLWSSSAPLLMAGAILFGVGSSPVWPAVVSSLVEQAPQGETGQALSLVFTAWLLGLGGGTSLVNFGYHWGPRVLLPLLAGAYLLPLVLAFFSRSLPVRRRKQKPPAPTHLTGLLRAVWRFRLLLPGAFAQTLSLGMLVPVLLPFCKESYGLNQAGFGALTLLGGLVTVILLLPVGKLVDRWGYRPFLVSGFLLGGVVLLALPVYRPHQMIYPYTLLLGTAYACILPAWNGLLAAHLPAAVRAGLYSVIMSIEGLGVALGPILGGKLGVTCGSFTIFYASALVLLVMACFYFNLHKRLPPPEAAPKTPPA